ncbi:DUF1566 domain-containing protein [Thioalkalivibrio sp. ALMg13-2]|uniref:DUF1566 domain-containing protein n=1 Tax=Thioalkalivibrio sp. ALMg13-2 TaxID=1158167 RepID=UPI00035D7C1B|nr:DUF1566 domain-containing protein [Thioalkalivibrio sp. ALMg13-2]
MSGKSNALGVSVLAASVVLAVSACGGGGAPDEEISKIDAEGNVLAADAESWQCLRDNTQDMIWDARSDEEGSFTYRGNTYTWYEPDLEGREGDEGTKNGGECQGSRCDTSGLAEVMNEAQYCGKDNWRLPTLLDLGGFAETLPFGTEPLMAINPYGGGEVWSSTEAAHNTWLAWPRSTHSTRRPGPRSKGYASGVILVADD